MRLLNTTTLNLKLFIGKNKPDYVILSHVWGEDEITFKDFDEDGVLKPCIAQRRAKSYKKLTGTAKQALKDKFEWMWIDTCAIDKSSSSELQEAINSMWRWYKEANLCYAYLADVPLVDFEASVWFTRGWTLQELLAPSVVEFFDFSWTLLGTKYSRADQIHKATNIDKDVLKGYYRYRNAATVFSWMAHRKTSREEDSAYSLFGLCEIMMPLLYGEGRPQAFKRLQLEIMRKHEDSTIFLQRSAGMTLNGPRFFELLSDNPDHFCQQSSCLSCHRRSKILIQYSTVQRIYFDAPPDMTLLSHGVRCTFLGTHEASFPSCLSPAGFKRHRSASRRLIMVLNLKTFEGMRIGLPLTYDYETSQYFRAFEENLAYVKRPRAKPLTFNVLGLESSPLKADRRLYLTFHHPNYKQTRFSAGLGFSRDSKIRVSRQTSFATHKDDAGLTFRDWDVYLAAESTTDCNRRLTAYFYLEPSQIPLDSRIWAACGKSYQHVPSRQVTFFRSWPGPEGWISGLHQVIVPTKTHAIDIQVRQMPSKTPQNPQDVYAEIRIEDIELEIPSSDDHVASVENASGDST